ncbi:MAG: hypothetical protein J6X60_13925 [Ruminiclostridium sp.]|nr:hypothetical protein [Ruminiclostridium sp.]
MSSIIKKVAKQNGVSVKEVRRDFEKMIKVRMSSKEPEAVMFWSQFGGNAPTPEQFIAAVTSSVRAAM